MFFQDENGEWYYEDSSYNQEGGEGNEGYEGWYQDEYGNWLNQFDWKQVLIKKCNQILKCIDSGGKKYALYSPFAMSMVQT